MESSCRVDELNKPLLGDFCFPDDDEQVLDNNKATAVPALESSETSESDFNSSFSALPSTTKNELDVTHHLSSVCKKVLAEDEEQEDEEEESSSTWTEEFIMWVVLPTLLFSQFGMAFLMKDERTANMSCTVVNLSIVLFVITSWLYRHACHDAKVKNILVLLMPEILMDVVLGLVLFNKVALGFMVLLVSMLFLSTFVVVTTATFLYFERKQQHKPKSLREVKELVACQVV